MELPVTYPTLGKGKHRLKITLGGAMSVPGRVSISSSWVQCGPTPTFFLLSHITIICHHHHHHHSPSFTITIIFLFLLYCPRLPTKKRPQNTRWLRIQVHHIPLLQPVPPRTTGSCRGYAAQGPTTRVQGADRVPQEVA